LRHSVARSKL